MYSPGAVNSQLSSSNLLSANNEHQRTSYRNSTRSPPCSAGPSIFIYQKRERKEKRAEKKINPRSYTLDTPPPHHHRDRRTHHTRYSPFRAAYVTKPFHLLCTSSRLVLYLLLLTTPPTSSLYAPSHIFLLVFELAQLFVVSVICESFMFSKYVELRNGPTDRNLSFFTLCLQLIHCVRIPLCALFCFC